MSFYVKFKKGNFVKAQRLRFPYETYNAKCGELGVPEMLLKGRFDRSLDIRSSVRKLVKDGLDVSGVHYTFQVGRKVDDRFVCKFQIQAKPTEPIQTQYKPCIDVLYTKSKWTGSMYLRDTDKLAFMCHEQSGTRRHPEGYPDAAQEARKYLEALIDYKYTTTSLGIVEQKFEKFAMKDLAESAAGPNRWQLDDSMEPWVDRVNVLLQWCDASGATYLIKEKS